MSKSENNKIKYLSPSSVKWKTLESYTDNNEGNKENFEELKSVLLSSLQMQNLCVLAGSGTSLGDVGGPSMADLWQKAAQDTVTKKPKSIVIKVSKLIGFNPDVENPNIEEFLSRCDAYLQFKAYAKILALVKSFKKIIVQECSFVNDKTNLRSHQMFLHRLSRRRVRDSRLKLFTTNYDTCFEYTASNLGLVVLDGFSFTQPRSYEPRFFGYDIVRRPRTGEDLGNYLEGVIQLYKLHGSITWAQEGSRIIEKINLNPEEACLIYPAKGKYQQSYIQPHLELVTQYFSALREPNTCLIVSGFGFNDDHLSEPILSAIQSNPHLRLIIADRDAEKKWDGGSGYWGKLKQLAEEGEDIWFINASFAEFAQLIPDLRSLSKADRLVKDIKSLSGGH